MSEHDTVNGAVAAWTDDPAFARSVGYQMVVHSIGLAMQNAVAQQQHANILLNAITTSATRAILESRAQDAQEAIKLAKEMLDPAAVAATLGELKDLLDRVFSATDASGAHQAAKTD